MENSQPENVRININGTSAKRAFMRLLRDERSPQACPFSMNARTPSTIVAPRTKIASGQIVVSPCLGSQCAAWIQRSPEKQTDTAGLCSLMLPGAEALQKIESAILLQEALTAGVETAS